LRRPKHDFPIGYKCGGLTVESEKVARTDGKPNNKWGYWCLCSYCGFRKWISYSTLCNNVVKSCGCYTRQLLSKNAVNASAALEAEKEFVRHYTDNKPPEPQLEDFIQQGDPP
jgi:hypothetical protein